MKQLDFLSVLEARENPVASPPSPVTGKTYRIADIPIVKPKPYQPDPWDRLQRDFEDVNLAEEKARIENERKLRM